MKIRHDVIEDSVKNLFKSLPPEVAERVHAKFAADRAEFLEYTKSNIPSTEPAYWAAKSCTACNSRGILGSRVKPDGLREPVPCACIARSYQKWLTEMRVKFNALRETK